MTGVRRGLFLSDKIKIINGPVACLEKKKLPNLIAMMIIIQIIIKTAI